MSQHDFDIANQGFAAFRADLNNALKALGSLSSGTAEPATTYANQLWYETDTNTLHIRNEANSAWLDLMVIDQSTGSPSFTAGNVGIGTDSPSAKLMSQVNTFTDADKVALKAYNAQGVGAYASFQNSVTGTAFTDGFRVGIDDSEDAVLQNLEATNMVFATSGTERMRITSAGNVGIGTISPAVRLHVDGGDGNHIRYSGATNNIAMGMTGADPFIGSLTSAPLLFLTGGTERARITSSGQFLVGRTTPRVNEFASITGSPASGAWMLECVNTRSTTSLNGILVFYPNAAPNNTTNQFFQCVDGLSTTRAEIRSNGGLANFSANNVNLSDERVKTDIAPVGSYWDKIKALQVVTYKYKDQSHDDDNIGVIAQQVESVAPEFVSNDGFGETPGDGVPLKSIYEADLHYATLKALQEAMARIEVLEARLDAANL